MKPSTLIFQRGDWSIEVGFQTWEAIISFLSQCGFVSEALGRASKSGNADIAADEAAHFAQAGEVILEETMKDPMTANSTTKFDMGKFAELVAFAGEGSFSIRNAGRMY